MGSEFFFFFLSSLKYMEKFDRIGGVGVKSGNIFYFMLFLSGSYEHCFHFSYEFHRLLNSTTQQCVDEMRRFPLSRVCHLAY